MGRDSGRVLFVAGVLAASFSNVLFSQSAMAGSHSSSRSEDPYFQLSAPVVEKLEAQEISWEEAYKLGMVSPESDTKVDKAADPIVVIDQIINIGKKIWDIIAAGRPVVNIQVDRASALPQGTQHWSQFEGWSNPTSTLYKISYTNGFGGNVVTFKFRILYTHGGKYDGKGKYLANVTIVPADTSVAWGYTFNASTEIPQVLNVGTKTNPIAGMELNVKWQVKTVVKEHQDSASFFIRGDGRILDLTNGN